VLNRWLRFLAVAALVVPGIGCRVVHREPVGTPPPVRPVRSSPLPIVYRLPVTVVAGSGWSPTKVHAAIADASRLFQHACGFALEASGLTWLPASTRPLDDGDEAALVMQVPRPRLVFVGATTANDVAYAYPANAPLAQAGTAWFTGQVLPACAGRLVAHELGHLALSSGAHESGTDDLMSRGCRASNIAGGEEPVSIEPRRCARLSRGLRVLEQPAAPGIRAGARP